MPAPTPILRPIEPADLSLFFTQQLDPHANHMAAFTAPDPGDRAAFDAHWSRILSDDTIVKRSIVIEHALAGHIMSFMQFGERELCYWIDRAYWGQGIATAALAAFLPLLATRPLYARVAQDNLGSIKVLQRGGFVLAGEARGAEIDEFIFRLAEKAAS